MWLPSTAPAHWGTFHFLSNPAMVSFSAFPRGNAMNFGSKCFTMASQVECTITHTVDRATPNKCPIVRYSAGVAKVQRVIASLHSTDIGDRKRVCCFEMKGLSWSWRKSKVVLLNLKFSNHSYSVKEETTCCHQCPDLSLTHCLRGRGTVTELTRSCTKTLLWTTCCLLNAKSLLLRRPITERRWLSWSKTARNLTQNKKVCDNMLNSWLERELHTTLQQLFCIMIFITLWISLFLSNT